MPKIRIDKILSSQGVGSRKDIHALIKSCRIKADNEIIISFDFKIDPFEVKIFIDGELIKYQQYIYIMLNKPSGILCVSSDPKQKTIIDLLDSKTQKRKVFPAGRLDKDTIGFVFVTDDGELAHKIMSPRSNVSKTYHAVLDGKITFDQIAQLEQGVILEDGHQCLSCSVKILKEGTNPLVEIILTEGKYHQVKRMFKSIGREVVKLKRLKIGGLPLDPSLGLSEYKFVGQEEIELIFGDDSQKLV